MALSGEYSREIFGKDGRLRHIKSLKEWPLESVLTEKYGYDPDDIEAICSLLLPMLTPDPKLRPAPGTMAGHEWLQPTEEEQSARDKLERSVPPPSHRLYHRRQHELTPHPAGTYFSSASMQRPRCARGGKRRGQRGARGRKRSVKSRISQPHGIPQRRHLAAERAARKRGSQLCQGVRVVTLEHGLGSPALEGQGSGRLDGATHSHRRPPHHRIKEAHHHAGGLRVCISRLPTRAAPMGSHLGLGGQQRRQHR